MPPFTTRSVDGQRVERPASLFPQLDRRATGRPARRPPWSRAVIALTLVAAALRLADLGGKSFWLDEAFSVALARAPWAVFARIVQTSEANMSLYYLVLRAWLHLGASESIVRLLSAIVGVATVPVVYAIGARLLDRRAGLASALIFAIDPVHLGLSQDARSYSLAILLVACSTWAFLHVVGLASSATEATGRGKAHLGASRDLTQAAWSAAYVITSAAAVYAHFYAAFVLLAQWASLVARSSARLPSRRLIACGICTGVLLLPLAAFVLRGRHGNLDWLAAEIPYAATHLAQSARSPLARLAAAYGTALLALAWLAERVLRRARRTSDGWPEILVSLWLVTPILLPLSISLFFKPVFDPRYAAVALPAIALLVGALMTNLSPHRARVTLAAILVLEAVGDWAYFTRVHKEDWRDATRAVLASATPGDVLLFYAPYIRRPYDYYVDRSFASAPPPRVLYPPASYSRLASAQSGDLTLPDAVIQAERAAPRTWLVLGHVWGDTTCLQALDASFRAVYGAREDRTFTGIVVRLYHERVPGAQPSGDGGNGETTRHVLTQQCSQR